MSAGLALLASLLWGGADFLGGTTSRRLRPVQVLAVSQVLSATVLVLVLGLAGGAPAGTGAGWLGWSLLAGVTWAGAMGALYTALARGTMGVVAPVASCGMLVPVVLGLLAGERPSTLQLLGAGVAVLGVAASAGPDLRGGGRARLPVLGLAALAALLFGVEIYAVAVGSRTSVPQTLLGMRLSSVVVVVVVLALTRRGAPPLRGGDLPPLLALGVVDLVATAAYALAARSGLVSTVAVLASLYPAVTVLLARQLHAERLSRVQWAGVGAVLAGAVATSLG